MDPHAQPPVTFFAMMNESSEANSSLVVRADVFPHLVMPVGPFVSAFWAPVVQMISNHAARSDACALAGEIMIETHPSIVV